MRAISVRIDSVKQLILIGERLGGCVFRGHGSINWRLESTIERAATRWGVTRQDLLNREQHLINAFQRRAHHFINDPPSLTDILEWHSLLQHYGGPTRLLDVTKSYFVATFFAVENATDDGVVWAFNHGPLSIKVEQESFKELMTIDECNAVLSGKKSDQGIRLIEPFRMNQRLASQQGAFLMPLSLEIDFEKQLERQIPCQIDNLMEISPSELDQHFLNPVWRIVIPPEIHSEIMRFLLRANVTASSLFEGLEGFARSLHTIMRIYD